VEFDIEQETLQAIIPPMTIQPLVENAYIHGLGDASENGFIRISSERKGEMLIISVSDDGKGMSDETRQHILNRNNSNGSFEQNKCRMHLTGIGIDNVVNRLRMFFGVEDVLQIKSLEGAGTTMMLTVPFIKNKVDAPKIGSFVKEDSDV
jgi:sensor histidine kinase YesM